MKFSQEVVSKCWERRLANLKAMLEYNTYNLEERKKRYIEISSNL